MPLTKEQLLIPRVLCIGTKEGEPNDTRGLWITGEIYTYKKHESDGYECYINDANTLAMPMNYPDKFPHLFKPLPWWYGRTVEDMPLYLIDKFGKVKRVLRHNTDFMTVIFNDDDWEESYAHYQPADESDYQEYQKQKQ